MRKLLGMLLVLIVFIPVLASAQIGPEESGLTDTGVAAYGGSADDLGTFIGERILAPAFGLMGIIFFVLVVYAGFLWMTSGGNTDQVAKAKRILVSVIVGTVIALGAFALTTFIFQSLAETTETADV